MSDEDEIKTLLRDPRLNSESVFKVKALSRVNKYLDSVEGKDIQACINNMDNTTKVCIQLSIMAGHTTFPGLDDKKKELFQKISNRLQNKSNVAKNMSVLNQEQNRENPTDKLSSEHYEKLLDKVELSPKEFMDELENLSPVSQLSFYQHIESINRILSDLDEHVVEALGTIGDQDKIQALLNDPRVNIEFLFKEKVLERVDTYLDSIRCPSGNSGVNYRKNPDTFYALTNQESDNAQRQCNPYNT